MRAISKPHYVFRPQQLLQRLRTGGLARTPWGEIRVADDVLGRGIARTGVHELAVSEVIWRLVEPGELAVDVGANVGYFTGLLARRGCEVVALEPNPLVLGILEENLARWARPVELLPRAASDHTGTAMLQLPAGFDENRGTASLEGRGERAYEVQTVRLEEVLGQRPIALLKIDVEGHEPAVLDGAPLERVRDVIFEEHAELPTPVSERLRAAGFEIRGIEESFLGPRLVDETPQGWDAPTYLATRRLVEAERLIAPRGWRTLRAR